VESQDLAMGACLELAEGLEIDGRISTIFGKILDNKYAILFSRVFLEGFSLMK
jgi:hypothetical protein